MSEPVYAELSADQKKEILKKDCIQDFYSQNFLSDIEVTNKVNGAKMQ